MTDLYEEQLALNPWEPITDPTDLKYLGKLGEETCELGSAVSRCIIQGMDGKEPDTGEVNRVWMTKEIADVLCNIELNIEHFGLDRELIARRIAKKQAHIKAWHDLA